MIWCAGARRRHSWDDDPKKRMDRHEGRPVTCSAVANRDD
jgi:hypothetical protein